MAIICDIISKILSLGAMGKCSCRGKSDAIKSQRQGFRPDPVFQIIVRFAYFNPIFNQLSRFGSVAGFDFAWNRQKSRSA